MGLADGLQPGAKQENTRANANAEREVNNEGEERGSGKGTGSGDWRGPIRAGSGFVVLLLTNTHGICFWVGAGEGSIHILDR